jgi:hypothetical protein
VNLEEVALAKYGAGCHRCHRSPCVCEAFGHGNIE